MRWMCVCAYDGAPFKGWQSQAGGGAIQDVIEAGLERILGQKIRIHGSSRTDTGVHARGMVFHFDGGWRHPPERLLAALRTVLPAAIQVTRVREVSPEFHARHAATGKRYRYYIYQGWADPFSRPYCWPLQYDLDLEAMKEAAAILRGRHDFASFSAYGRREMETTIRDLRTLEISRHGRRVMVTAEADGFLYKMVRSLVGGLVNVGIGKLTPREIQQILQDKRRIHLIETAPPQGLFLEKVFYPPGALRKPAGARLNGS